MVDLPKIKPHFRATILPGDGVFFVSATDMTVLMGRHFEVLVPLLKGEWTPDELVDQVAGELSPAEVYFALEELDAGGFLAAPSPGLSDCEAAFWEESGISAAAAAVALSELTIRVAAVGMMDSRLVEKALHDSGFRISDDGAVTLVFADHYLRPELSGINAAELRRGRPWLLVRPLGPEIWIGPLFVPGKTGCWECLAERLRGNLQIDEYLLRRLGSLVPPAAGALASTVLTAANLAALEVLRWQAGDQSSLAGQVLAVNLMSRQTTTHRLVRRPQCPACGNSSVNLSAPILRSVHAVLCGDGGQRTETPEETYSRLQHHVSPITGIVKSIDPSHLPPGPAHVFSAGHNLAFRSRKLSVLQKHMRSRSGGKGMTEAQARAAALCEALERYSSQFQGNEHVVRKRLADLEGEGLHPNSCMLFSSAQYDRRRETNPSAGEFHFVPEPFSPEAEVDWVSVWSLTHERFRYLPAAYVYFHTPALPGSDAVTSCFPDSNGNASGNTLEEAVLQGLLEVVERDAVAIWWYNRIPRLEIPLELLDEPYFLEVKEYYRELGRDFWLLDLTADTDIPVIAAVSRCVEGKRDNILLGFGAHLDLRLAAQRAVSEMNQFLPKALAADQGKSLKDLDDDTRRWFQQALAEDQPYVLPHGVSVRTCGAEVSDDLLHNITECRRRLEALGLEVLIADMTRPDVGLHVAKAIVPGMRHFWRRLAPGRLYTVPVTMGWLPAPLREEDMNSFPMFV